MTEIPGVPAYNPALLTRRAAEGELERSMQPVRLIDLSGDIKKATSERLGLEVKVASGIDRAETRFNDRMAERYQEELRLARREKDMERQTEGARQAEFERQAKESYAVLIAKMEAEKKVQELLLSIEVKSKPERKKSVPDRDYDGPSM